MSALESLLISILALLFRISFIWLSSSATFSISEDSAAFCWFRLFRWAVRFLNISCNLMFSSSSASYYCRASLLASCSPLSSSSLVLNICLSESAIKIFLTERRLNILHFFLFKPNKPFIVMQLFRQSLNFILFFDTLFFLLPYFLGFFFNFVFCMAQFWLYFGCLCPYGVNVSLNCLYFLSDLRLFVLHFADVLLQFRCLIRVALNLVEVLLSEDVPFVLVLPDVRDLFPCRGYFFSQFPLCFQYGSFLFFHNI